MTPDLAKRVMWMDSVRGAMILLVILFHGAARVERYDEGSLQWIEHFNLFWEPFRMPALVFLSGMLLARSLSKPRALYVTGKVRTLLWPYLIWSLAFILALGATGAGDSTDPLWLQVLAIGTGTATYLWFLSFLFAYYMISLFIGAKGRVWLIPVALIGASALQFMPWGYQGQKFLFLLAFFWLGDLVQRRGALDATVTRRAPIIVVAAILAAAVGTLATFELVGRYATITALGVAAGVLCLVLLAQAITGTRTAALLAYIGRDTVVFYTSHYLIIAGVYFILARIFDVTNPLLLFVAVVVGALVGGAVLVWARRRSPIVDALFVLPWPKVRTSVTAA